MGTTYHTKPIVRDGLVLYIDAANKESYPGSGTSCFDLQNTSRTYSLVNGITLEGNPGNFVFGASGVDDYIDIINIYSTIQSNTQGTFSLWVKPTDGTPSSVNCLIGFGDNSANTRLFVNLESNGKFGANLTLSGAINWGLETDSAVFSDGEWHNVVISHNGTSSILYVNGVSPAQAYFITTNKTKWINDLTSIDNVYIGARKWNGGVNSAFFEGSMGPIQIYNKALSSSEVAQNYNALKNRFI